MPPKTKWQLPPHPLHRDDPEYDPSDYGIGKFFKGEAYITEALMRVRDARTRREVKNENLKENIKNLREINALKEEKFRRLETDLDEKTQGCGQRLDKIHAGIRSMLEGKKAELETTFEDAQRRILRLKSQAQDQAAEIGRLTNQATTQTEIIEKQKSEIDRLKEQVGKTADAEIAAEKLAQELRDKTQSQAATIKDHESTIGKLKEQASAQTETIQQQKADIDRLNQQAQETTNIGSASEKLVQELQEKVRTQAAKNELQRGDISRLKEQASQQSKTNKNRAEGLRQLEKGALANAKTTATDVFGSMARQQRTIATYIGKQIFFMNRIRMQEKTLVVRETQIARLRNSLNQTNHRLNDSRMTAALLANLAGATITSAHRTTTLLKIKRQALQSVEQQFDAQRRKAEGEHSEMFSLCSVYAADRRRAREYLSDMVKVAGVAMFAAKDFQTIAQSFKALNEHARTAQAQANDRVEELSSRVSQLQTQTGDARTEVREEKEKFQNLRRYFDTVVTPEVGRSMANGRAMNAAGQSMRRGVQFLLEKLWMETGMSDEKFNRIREELLQIQ